jgi:hypothetical protein
VHYACAPMLTTYIRNIFGGNMRTVGVMGRSMATAVIAVAALTGCVTISEPVPVGRDTYMISMGARGGMSGTNSELLLQAVKKAGAFCQSSGREIEVHNTNSSGIPGWTAQSGEVIFACLAATDPKYVEPKYSPAPNIIIEHRER